MVTDPYSVAMYSTESEDFNFLEERDKQGVPADEAVMMLAKQKYGLVKWGKGDKIKRKKWDKIRNIRLLDRGYCIKSYGILHNIVICVQAWRFRFYRISVS